MRGNEHQTHLETFSSGADLSWSLCFSWCKVFLFQTCWQTADKDERHQGRKPPNLEHSLYRSTLCSLEHPKENDNREAVREAPARSKFGGFISLNWFKKRKNLKTLHNISKCSEEEQQKNTQNHQSLHPGGFVRGAGTLSLPVFGKNREIDVNG